MDQLCRLAADRGGALPKGRRPALRAWAALACCGLVSVAGTAHPSTDAPAPHRPQSIAATARLLHPEPILPPEDATGSSELRLPGIQQPRFITPAGVAEIFVTPPQRIDLGTGGSDPSTTHGRATVPQPTPPASPPASGWRGLWDQLAGSGEALPTDPPDETPTVPHAGAPSHVSYESYEPTPTTTIESDRAPRGGQWTSPATGRAEGLLDQLMPTAGAHGPSPPDHTPPAVDQQPLRRPTAAHRAPPPAPAASGESVPSGVVKPPDGTPLAAMAFGTEDQPGRLAELWRPLVMRQDETVWRAADSSTAPEPIGSTRSTAARESIDVPAQRPAAGGRTGTLEDSLLLRPFYLTNVPANAARPSAAPAMAVPAATQPEAPALDDALRSSSLVRQLTLSSDEQLRRPDDAQAPPLIQSEHLAWERPWASFTPLLAAPFTQTDWQPTPAGLAGPDGDAQLVAFLQDAPEEPATLDLEDGDETSLAEAEQIGEEPEDTSLQFLRTAAVLLEPGQSQCDIGLHYLFTDTNFPILLTDEMDDIIGIEDANFRIRELKVPLQYRLGLVPRVQGFIGTEVGWANTELSLNTLSQSQNDGGLGDLQFGLTMQLADAAVECPYTILTIRATAPTGGDPFTGAAGFAPTAPSLGQGFWSLAGNVLWIQPYDPIVLFYGVGAEYFFSRRYVGVDINPGTQFNYTYGVGFSVNERVTLSGRFFGAYVTHLKVDGERRFKSNFEPMSVRLAATISKPKRRIVEPFVEFGLTDEAVSSFFGVTWTF